MCRDQEVFRTSRTNLATLHRMKSCWLQNGARYFFRSHLRIRLRFRRHASECDAMRQSSNNTRRFSRRSRNRRSRVADAALVVEGTRPRTYKRRRRDSNPRYREAVHRFSRPALSTTQAPLRHFGDSSDSLRKARRSWKNSLSTSPHSSAKTPEVIGTRWLSRGSETRRYRLSQAPALGSVAP
jgi:hypothetical protein